MLPTAVVTTADYSAPPLPSSLNPKKIPTCRRRRMPAAEVGLFVGGRNDE